jgi:hypothetical protein
MSCVAGLLRARLRLSTDGLASQIVCNMRNQRSLGGHITHRYIYNLSQSRSILVMQSGNSCRVHSRWLSSAGGPSTRPSRSRLGDVKEGSWEGTKFVVGSFISSFADSIAYYVVLFGALLVGGYLALRYVTDYGRNAITGTKDATMEKINTIKEKIMNSAATGEKRMLEAKESAIQKVKDSASGVGAVLGSAGSSVEGVKSKATRTIEKGKENFKTKFGRRSSSSDDINDKNSCYKDTDEMEGLSKSSAESTGTNYISEKAKCAKENVEGLWRKVVRKGREE